MSAILLVEDDRDILEVNRNMLEAEGYHVRAAENLAQARASVEKARPDAIVLDILLPDGNGLDFLAELRGSGNDAVPVLLLSSLGTSDNIVRGLVAGGDDYLPKPYDFGVFLARVAALLRRGSRVSQTFALGALRFDLAAGRAWLAGADLLLPPREFALLVHFAQHAGQTLPAALLEERIYGMSVPGGRNALQVCISRLRRKLEGSGYDIEAVRSEGYRFE